MGFFIKTFASEAENKERRVIMENLFFLLGMAFGIILTIIFRRFKTAIGYFKLEPYDEDDTGFYKINIRIPGESNERLLHANKIILHKEKSQN